MDDDAGPHEHPRKVDASTGSRSILHLTDEERGMLRECASQLRSRSVRNQVAREALDRAADELDQAASTTQT